MDLNQSFGHSYDTDLLVLRTLFALNPDTNLPISTNYVVTTDGIGGLVWMSPFQNLSTAGAGIGYLPSTIDGMRSNISTLSTQVSSLVIGLSSLSTVLGQSYISSGIYIPQLQSTVQGLATSGFLSTTQLQSTVIGLGSAQYVSTPSLVSTTAWFQDPSRFVSTGALVSTTSALLGGSNLLSTVAGLGTIGYISSASLRSTIISTTNAFSTFAYSTFLSSMYQTFISTGQLISTVSSLGSLGYVSSSGLASTVAWFQDPSRYVSTGALVSTTAGISTNVRTTFYIDSGGNFNILGGTAIVSSAASVVFLSTFVISSLTYQGVNGVTTATRYPDATLGNHMFFSTAKIRFDNFSSYILTNSRINLQLNPTLVFPRLNTGATTYSLFPMSTLIAYSNTYLTPQVTTGVFAVNQATGFGNLYSQPIQIQIPGCNIFNKYANDYVICHNIVSSVTSNLTNGFVGASVEVLYGSTNSVFLSIQNLP